MSYISQATTKADGLAVSPDLVNPDFQDNVPDGHSFTTALLSGEQSVRDTCRGPAAQLLGTMVGVPHSFSSWGSFKFTKEFSHISGK